MNSMEKEDFQAIKRETGETGMEENEMRLRSYLVNESPIKYDDSELEDIVEDVLDLDDDLGEYVRCFLQTGETDTDLGCELIGINDLLQIGNFTPVTAALVIHWYRRDSLGVISYLVSQGMIPDICDELRENSDDDDKSAVNT